jgi:hypothetical protein
VNAGRVSPGSAGVDVAGEELGAGFPAHDQALVDGTTYALRPAHPWPVAQIGGFRHGESGLRSLPLLAD